MKPSEIKVGKTYYGKYSNITRTVRGIGEKNTVTQGVVFYREQDMDGIYPLSWGNIGVNRFAAWAEGEVND